MMRPLVRAATLMLLVLSPANAAPLHPDVAHLMPNGARIEVHLYADVTGDGVPENIAVGTNDKERRLVVMAQSPRGSLHGLSALGSTQLDPSPLGSASLRVVKGVLIVEDLTGGTTALSSTYRWRYDPAVRKMRLIGDDVSLYSRTWAHDGKDISTNRLTGVQIVTLQKLKGRGENASYAPAKPIRKAVSRDPIYMGSEPTPEKTMGWGD